MKSFNLCSAFISGPKHLMHWSQDDIKWHCVSKSWQFGVAQLIIIIYSVPVVTTLAIKVVTQSTRFDSKVPTDLPDYQRYQNWKKFYIWVRSSVKETTIPATAQIIPQKINPKWFSSASGWVVLPLRSSKTGIPANAKMSTKRRRRTLNTTTPTKCFQRFSCTTDG